MRPFLFALMLSACGIPESPQGETEALMSGSAVVRVSSSAEAPMHYAKHFEISETDAVNFVAQIAALQGTHSVVFDIFDPLGNPYQTITTPFEIENERSEAVGSLPVNGTWISQYAMTGQWTCQAFIDGAPTEAAHVAFILR